MEFEEFPKVPRLSRGCVITEKIDGTNAQVMVDEDGTVTAASRTRIITPRDDNHGFAAWVAEHAEELRKLGPGRHFGEWWGLGIQRGYGLKEKRFSLFNTARWDHPSKYPACCYVVPTLYMGPFVTSMVDLVIDELKENGSRAAPGFMKPEGLMIFHQAANHLFKKTIVGDEAPKGKQAA